MGAVTSKEGYDLEGRKFCKENFHFLENYIEKLSSDSQRFPLKIFAIIMCSRSIPLYIFQRIGSTAQKGTDWGGSKVYSL